MYVLWKVVTVTVVREENLTRTMATSLCTPSYSNFLNLNNGTQLSHHNHKLNSSLHFTPRSRFRFNTKISCSNNDDTTKPQQPQSQSIQLYSQIEKFVSFFPSLLSLL
jgi:hypothetical protein